MPDSSMMAHYDACGYSVGPYRKVRTDLLFYPIRTRIDSRTPLRLVQRTGWLPPFPRQPAPMTPAGPPAATGGSAFSGGFLYPGNVTANNPAPWRRIVYFLLQLRFNGKLAGIDHPFGALQFCEARAHASFPPPECGRAAEQNPQHDHPKPGRDDGEQSRHFGRVDHEDRDQSTDLHDEERDDHHPGATCWPAEHIVRFWNQQWWWGRRAVVHRGDQEGEGSCPCRVHPCAASGWVSPKSLR